MTQPDARIRHAARLLVLLASLTSAATLPANDAGALPASRPVSPPSAWSDGNALGRTTNYLQTAWASDCPPPSGRCATDRGPYMGVFWQRARTTSPATWGPPHRLSQPHMQAARPALAAAQAHVYVAWVTQRSYLHYRANAPRRLWIRWSGDQGATWGPTRSLNPPGGRVDYPVIAASGNDAWVVWTAAGTGDIQMASTSDGGAHWTATTIGTTTSGAGSREGFHAYPAVGASDTDVVAAWFAGPAGKQVALVSSNSAADWTSGSVPTTLTSASPNDGVHYPVVRGADDGSSNKVAVAYSTASGIAVRIYGGASLGPPLPVAGPWSPTSTYEGGYGAAAVPFGTGHVAIVWSGCRHVKRGRNPCRPSVPSSRIDLLERETANGGASWSARVRLAAAIPSLPVNEAPSLEADGTTGLRSFIWLRRTARWTSYRLWVDNIS